MTPKIINHTYMRFHLLYIFYILYYTLILPIHAWKVIYRVKVKHYIVHMKKGIR